MVVAAHDTHWKTIAAKLAQEKIITATGATVRYETVYQGLLALKPYRGGNPALWALHWLDITRKHRRLLDVQIRPIHLSMSGALKPGDFEPLHGEPFQVGAETVIGLLRKGVPGPAMKSRFYVTISESGVIKTRPVLATLIYLADAATAAIKVFDA